MTDKMKKKVAFYSSCWKTRCKLGQPYCRYQWAL